jgi:hypothetical protein
MRLRTRVRSLADQRSTDIDIVVLAAVAAVLSRSSGCTDVLIGRAVNTGPAGIVAPAGNALVLRVDTSDDPRSLSWSTGCVTSRARRGPSNCRSISWLRCSIRHRRDPGSSMRCWRGSGGRLGNGRAYRERCSGC